VRRVVEALVVVIFAGCYIYRLVLVSSASWVAYEALCNSCCLWFVFIVVILTYWPNDQLPITI